MSLDERQRELVAAAAATFCAHGMLGPYFIDEHEVSFSEGTQLLETIGEVLLGFLALPPQEQLRVRFLGAGLEPDLVHAMLAVATHHQALGQAADLLAQGPPAPNA